MIYRPLLRWYVWVATPGYASKTCVLPDYTLTDNTEHVKQNSHLRQRCHLFSSFTDVTSTIWQFLASGRKVHKHTCPLHLKTNGVPAVTSVLGLSSRSRKGSDCKTVTTTSSLHQTSVFYLPLSHNVLSPCQSVSLFSNSLQKPAKMHCHMILTSQLKWHTGYSLTMLKLQHYANNLNYSFYMTTNYLCYNS